jgi:MoaA/NifB/PqqE/SkfB family radical SAM enzyme
MREYAADLGLQLVWDLPVPYSSRNPIALETQDEVVADGAGKAWLYVEPDGDVLPAQGVNQVLGNLLREDWDSIWRKTTA